LENVEAGSPEAKARQPILGAKFNFLSLFCEARRQKHVFPFLIKFILFW